MEALQGPRLETWDEACVEAEGLDASTVEYAMEELNSIVIDKSVTGALQASGCRSPRVSAEGCEVWIARCG